MKSGGAGERSRGEIATSNVPEACTVRWACAGMLQCTSDCVRACYEKAIQAGHSYFGVQFGRECWHGNDLVKAKSYGKSAGCPNQIGGRSENAIYSTEISKYLVSCPILFIGFLVSFLKSS